MNNLERRGTLLVLATALISGFSIFLNKYAVEGFNPYVFTWLKNVLVASFLLSLVVGLGEVSQFKKLSSKNWLLLVAIGLIGGSIPFLLFFKGVSLTTAANASFIHKSMFLYVALLAGLFLKEKVDRRILIAGALLLLGNALFLKVLPFGLGQGDLLILLATLFWAVENTLSKYVLEHIKPKIVALGRMGFGSLFILIFLVATGNLSPVAGLSAAQIGWVGVTSLLLFGYVFTWYSGLKHVKATVATTILLLGGPVTALLSFGAGLDPIQVLGGLILVSGAILSGRIYELIRPQVSG